MEDWIGYFIYCPCDFIIIAYLCETLICITIMVRLKFFSCIVSCYFISKEYEQNFDNSLVPIDNANTKIRALEVILMKSLKL